MVAKMYNLSGWVTETQADVLFSYYEKALLDCGFKIVSTCHKFFSPFGFTALFLLSESHFAIHTFPEEGKSYVELSSCVEGQFDRFMRDFSKNIIDLHVSK